jgi:lysophospholipase L1-like esterase
MFILLVLVFKFAFFNGAATALKLPDKPVLYIIGDSTVQNNDGNGKNEYLGWGTLLNPYLDTTRITLRNHTKSGTSTRTFMTDGRWTKVLETLKNDDFVIMQFGHNDQAAINDSSISKGTLKGQQAPFRNARL